MASLVTTLRRVDAPVALRASTTPTAASSRRAVRPGPGLGDRRPPRRPTPRSAGWRLNAASGAGRTMVIAGALILAFAGYQVWGTGLLEQYRQRALDAELDAQLLAAKAPPAELDPTISMAAPSEDADSPGTPGTVETPGAAEAAETVPTPAPAATAPSTPDPTPAPAPAAAPAPAPVLPQMALAEGDVVGRIEIASIAVSKAIVHGVQRETLRQGPGLYPSTARPGEPGNVAIAGHRTTHGAPFFDLDKLQPGDPITIETIDGVYTYLVEGHENPDGTVAGHRIVDPSAVHVIADHGDNRLTLTACHPKFSAQQRIVVSALLVSGPPPAPPSGPAEATGPTPAVESPPTEPLAAPPAEPTRDSPPASEPAAADPVAATSPQSSPADAVLTTPTEPMADSLGWQRSELDAAVLWATVLGLASATAWLGGRLWRPRWVYPLASPVVLGPLLVFFVHLDRLLPAI